MVERDDGLEVGGDTKAVELNAPATRDSTVTMLLHT